MHVEEGEYRTIKAAVCRLAEPKPGQKAAALFGAAEQRLRALVAEIGVERTREIIRAAPVRSGMMAPSLIDWMADQAHADVDFLAELDARIATAPDEISSAEPAPIDQAPRPTLRPVSEVLAADGAPASPENVSALLREARGLLDPLGDHPTGRLNPTEVTQ